MSISKETIASVQNRVCIEEVIADFLPLKKRDKNSGLVVPFLRKIRLLFLFLQPKAYMLWEIQRRRNKAILEAIFHKKTFLAFTTQPA